MRPSRLLLLSAVLAVGVTPVALAGKDKHEHKEEFWDGDCKIERKWKKNGEYKEERKCAPPQQQVHVIVAPPVVSPTPVVVIYPPWLEVQQGQAVYQQGWEVPAQPAPRPQPVYRCNSATTSAILGGILGGLAGHQIGGGSGKTAATIGGAIAGVLIGGEIGKRIDAQNQACIGQALEVAPAGQQFLWNDPNQPAVQYAVVPGPVEKRGNQYCRPFAAIMNTNGTQQQTNQVACRQADGTWVRYQ